ncbi:MAG: hypothetical protein AB1521_00230 [Bacteroidota bacterium]
MKLNKTILIITLLVGLITLNNIYAQGRVYDGPDDPEGDIAAIRAGVMNGNRVLLSFKNTTRLGDWPSPSASRWPNDNTGSYMVDGLAVLIGGMVFLEQDTIPVTDAAKIASKNNYDTLWYVQTSYAKQLMDQNSKGTVDWGLYPVFGYFNELQDYAAMSNQPETWPVNGWPASGSTKKWPGEWNGRFGRGIKYAALETYFVANDAQDQEYLQPNLTVKYYPRPGLKIGDKLPDVTIQKGMPWGGLGLRVEVRGFQWNNPQTRDAIFWEYNISNISDYDLPRIAFGAWLDNGIGGGPTDDFDDVGFYDKYEDLAYSWDMNATAVNGLVPGVMGWAFLESPGISNDNIDNDDDGLTDEKRDNEAFVKVDKLSGINNLEKFLKWYHIEESELKEHWDADEDQDWRDGEDTNENGVYDTDEDAGDDVGLDGVGPNDLNYNGPDEGECNHKPDYKEGIGCEPNFAATDIDESDMIGLTSFRMFIHPQGWSPSASFDKDCWNVFASDSLIEYFGTPTNLIEMFGSGQFRLDKGRTERFSLAEIHAYEDLSSLSTAKHAAPSLYSKKAIVQTIYESDYRFAQAPVLPTLSAQALDGKVILTWNDAADKLTREPLLRGENDFEGYKLYKATDKKFGDAELLFDGYGNPAGKKALYQCDLIDGKSGFAQFSLFNGLAFYLGDETGIKHYYVDENVQNGRTYYYALVAYDYGIEVFGKDSASVLPSENDAILDLTEDEAIRFVGQNVQIVTPHQAALGYVPESFEITEGRELFDLCGTITPTILNSAKLKNGGKYKVKFSIKELGHLRSPSYRHPTDINYTTNGFYIYDVTESDTLIYSETSDNFREENFVSKDILNNGTSVWCLNEEGVKSDLFDGMQLSIENTSPQSKINIGASGWITGKANVSVMPSILESRFFPWQYDIVFSNEPYTSITTYAGSIKSVSGRLLSTDAILLNQSFNFYVQNKSFPDANGNYEKLDLLVHDVNKNGVFDRDVDTVLVGNTIKIDTRVFWSGTVLGINFSQITSESDMPKANDVYRVNFTRPYYANDSVSFTIKEPVNVVETEIKQNLNKIKVVPNPYIATNMMEEAFSNPYLSQRRQLLFTHLPAECIIKIFTTSGVLVRELIVENSADDGTTHWDMLTKEGLEIAAGIYVFHVKAKVTGDEFIGKFAVVK